MSSSEYNRRYYIDHRADLLPKARKHSVEWCKNNKALRNKRDRARRKAGPTANPAAQRRYRERLRRSALEAYGGKCSCCGETVTEFLTIDHVDGGGTKHRKAMTAGGGVFHLWLKQHGYPPGFRVLCWNCNWSAHLGNGICYHQRVKLIVKS